MEIAKLLRNIGLTGVASLITAGFNFLLGVYLARALGADGRGALSVVMNSLNIFFPLTALGIQQAGAYLLKLNGWSVSALESLHRKVLPISWLLTVCAFVVALKTSTSNFPSAGVLASIGGVSLFRLSLEYRSGILLSKGRVDYFNFLNIVRSVLDLVLIVLLFSLFGAAIEIYLIGIAASYIVSGLVQERMLASCREKNDDHKLADNQLLYIIRRGISYAFPLFIMGINYSADIMMLSVFGVKKADIGNYTIAVSIATMMWLVPKIANIAIFSHSLNINKKDKKEFSFFLLRYSFYILGITAVVTFLAYYLIVKDIIVWVYGTQFLSSYDALGWLLPGVLLMVLFKFLNGNLAALGRPDIALKIFSSMAILNILMNYFMIPGLGIAGAAIASTISYSLGTLIFVIAYRHICDRL